LPRKSCPDEDNEAFKQNQFATNTHCKLT
jgi:hypothetical protein